MKKVVITILLIFCAIISFAQSEKVKPTYGVELDREVYIASIEGKIYHDVIVELKSADITNIFVEGVKVTVKETKTGKQII